MSDTQTKKRHSSKLPGSILATKPPRGTKAAVRYAGTPENVLEYFNVATSEEKSEGATWYGKTQAYAEELAYRYGVGFLGVVGTLAGMSPNNNWHTNKILAVRIIERFVANLDDCQNKEMEVSELYTDDWTGVGLRRNVKKCLDCLRTDSLEPLKVGRKIYNFALAISGDPLAVTLDRWMYRIYMDRPEWLPQSGAPNTKVYDRVADEFTTIAADLNLSPVELQAICWLVIRRLEMTANTVDAFGRFALDTNAK